MFVRLAANWIIAALGMLEHHRVVGDALEKL
jgi:hypothetical protein